MRRRPGTRRAAAIVGGLVLGLWAAAANADLRVKIDRYEPATLPDVQLWVSILDGDQTVDPERVTQISVYVNGALVDDVDVESAADHGAPMAVAAVIDARLPQKWKAARDAIGAAFSELPSDSIGAVRAIAYAVESVPADPKTPWLEEPEKLAPSLTSIDSSQGGEPRLFAAVRSALLLYPLAPGLEADKDDGPLPADLPDGHAFPNDRVLYVIGDGQIELRGDQTVTRQLQTLVYLARRRGVRIMAIGAADSDRARDLWVLETLARKTGGTYRRAALPSRIGPMVAEAAEELAHRQVITADAEELRRGDPISFSVRVKLNTGESRTTRDFTDRAGNVLSLWDKVVDAISNKWEGLPVWARILISVVAGVLVLAIVLLVVLLRVRKASKARAAVQAQREADLAERKPCPVCGNMMMPTWRECLFCAQARQAQRPMRFRLIGRSGAFAGRALRFDKNLVIFGAAPNCDVYLPEHGVAPEHCGLRDRGDGEFLLSDFNTPGGTWVNGERIEQATLGEGDVLRVGASEFVFGVES